MPRLVVKGMKKEDLIKVSDTLLVEIEKIIDRPKDSFTLDLLDSVAIYEGKEISRVHVEVSWKSRPTEVCQTVANAIHDIIKPLGYDTIYVYFKDLDLEKEFIF